MKKVLLCLVFLVCLLKAVTIDELVKHTNENNYDLKSIDKSQIIKLNYQRNGKIQFYLLV